MSFIYENVEDWLRREAQQSGEPYEFLRLVRLCVDELLEEYTETDAEEPYYTQEEMDRINEYEMWGPEGRPRWR